MSAILEDVLDQAEFEYCTCIEDNYRLCPVHDIIKFIRERYKIKMSDNFLVEEFYKDI